MTDIVTVNIVVLVYESKLWNLDFSILRRKDNLYITRPSTVVQQFHGIPPSTLSTIDAGGDYSLRWFLVPLLLHGE